MKGLKRAPDHGPSKSLVGSSEHLAQFCLPIGERFGKDVYHQWVLSDDLWAGRHRDLADGILRFAQRWDVLTA